MVTIASALAVKLAKARLVSGAEEPGDWLRRRYIDELATYRQLSAELGYADGGPRAVRSLLEHFAIPIRRGSEAVASQWKNNPERRKAAASRLSGAQLVHGESKPRTGEYKTWMSMHERCANPTSPAFRHYGGRGIKVCERWASFENFLADMGRRPPGLQIERIDNDRGYSPENCKWATRTENTRNRRVARMVTLDGKRIHIFEACDRLGMSRKTVLAKIRRGLSPDEAIRAPVRERGDRLRS